MGFKPLPIGVDDFEKIIKNGYYYVDKTLFIKELLDKKGEINLFTRPRRFGKTLNMSMLRRFFETGYEDAAQIFAGLKIMETGEAYTRHMSQYPVISISLKSMKQADYGLSYIQMKKMIAEEFRRHDRILEMGKLTEAEKERFRTLRDVKGTDGDYLDALKFLSTCLMACYGTKTIILIDEYDVPLENAYFEGFYDRMIPTIRSLFESALKTNENLEFAVVTGCLRISRESIFTGLNNLKAVSITTPLYGEHFGFTQGEVEEMLRFYGRSGFVETARRWYDGYSFGNTEVYNPWSVINYVEYIWADEKSLPCPFWANTSSNSIVRTLIERADVGIREEIEILIQGGSIEKPLHEDITYEDMEPGKSDENLWNFLFFTGYLRKTGERMADNARYVSLRIPNEEIRYLYKNTVLAWFEQKVKRKDFSAFYKSVIEGDVERFEKTVSQMLREGISFYDTKEAFYHGFLMGLFQGMEDYYAYSNREAGDGRYDICLKSPEVEKPAVLLELKAAASYKEMEELSRQALRQIELKRYEEDLVRDGYRDALCYGIAFYKKNCRIALVKREIG